MIKKATKEWLKRKKIVAVKLFSESVAEGTFNSWEEWVDDCDFDFILYSTGQEQGDGFTLRIKPQTIPSPQSKSKTTPPSETSEQFLRRLKQSSATTS